MKTLFLILVIAAALPLEAARTFVRASNEMITANSGAVSGYPISMSAWFRTDDLTVNECIVANNVETTGIGVYLLVRGIDAGDPLSASDYDGSTAARANSGGSVTSGVWHHGGAVFRGLTDRSVYLNGTRTDNSTAVTSYGAPDRTRVGTFLPGNSHWSGEIAEVAIWNVELTDSEMTALAAGCSPLRIRPSALQFYTPLWPGIFDYRKGVALTASGTNASSLHPRIYRSP